MGSEEQLQAVQELKDQFRLRSDRLKQLSQHLRGELEEGLHKNNANVAMLPSWISKHPTGQETGEYLGLDLSGSFIRIYFVTLHGQGRISTRQQKYLINDTLKKGPVTHMIDFLAQSVDQFLTFLGKSSVSEPLALGFVLSFPLAQTAINKASVLQWTKDFEITGADNKNIAELLQIAFQKHKTPVVVEAVINGAVGCLLAHSYRSLDTLVACTVSTGTNAAYWEKVSKVEKLKGHVQDKDKDGDMIINTEWGSFSDKHPQDLPRTVYDNCVNRCSVNPEIHLFEKMVSGLYLGELSRSIIVDFMDRRLLFDGQYSKEISTQNAFETSYMSAISSDETPELESTKHILEAIMNIPSTTIADRQIVHAICEAVGRRAARLVAAAISAIIDKRNALEEGLTISVEGAIYEHYPNFPRHVNESLRSIYGDSVDRINIGVTRDGNGIGGAVAAMIARKCKNE
ncbi:uncharacterized protein BYT42DRAFT_492039 [Radiomyces spectabilis]|uniref:uncharacterized protein n=1 Tax=Radiomyces spectabilis TaxID=64574 RepID=UPI00221FDF47|nr:uncharacterized protein BYT42DRAFT_492039 [Radiomyces spectabilis]KAI8388215.1 hypothetical protein BYT42DRAFT_492039 [Radiomyces spectabilis]